MIFVRIEFNGNWFDCPYFCLIIIMVLAIFAEFWQLKETNTYAFLSCTHPHTDSHKVYVSTSCIYLIIFTNLLYISLDFSTSDLISLRLLTHNVSLLWLYDSYMIHMWSTWYLRLCITNRHQIAKCIDNAFCPTYPKLKPIYLKSCFTVLVPAWRGRVSNRKRLCYTSWCIKCEDV